MRRYRKFFPNKNSLLPVIHVRSYEQALENVKIARGEGADGVFFISHGHVSDDYVAACQSFIKTEFPDLWSGVNFLSCCIAAAVSKLPMKANGLWSDGHDITEAVSAEVPLDRYLNSSGFSAKVEWEGLYFGGVAFKYQTQPKNLAEFTKKAARYVNVVTTSGDATGKPPSVEKITIMRKAIPDFPLAIASGMTPENVAHYKEIADCFLVSTGINKEGDFFHLDPRKVAIFKKNIS